MKRRTKDGRFATTLWLILKLPLTISSIILHTLLLLTQIVNGTVLLLVERGDRIE